MPGTHNAPSRLKKATYFIAWLILLKNKSKWGVLVGKQQEEEPNPKVAETIKTAISHYLKADFANAVDHFRKQIGLYIQANGGNEDSALKNTALVEKVIGKLDQKTRDSQHSCPNSVIFLAHSLMVQATTGYFGINPS